MDKTLSSVLHTLHESLLKPEGFHKQGATFSRRQESYGELFCIRASQHNGPWGRSFYVNCVVVFADLAVELPCSGLPEAHWAAPLDALVPSALRQWDCSHDEDVAALAERLGGCILSASGRIAADLGRCRRDYLARLTACQRQRLGPAPR
jgi:hypothetical protein